jgi:hypothetical protein
MKKHLKQNSTNTELELVISNNTNENEINFYSIVKKNK